MPRKARFILLGVAGLLVVMAVLVMVALDASREGESSLLIVNRGSNPLTRITLQGSRGDEQHLKSVGPGDSIRYELTGLKEEYYSLEVTRADSSGFWTPVGVMVSDNVGVDDTIYVSDLAFEVVPPRDSSDKQESWPARRREP